METNDSIPIKDNISFQQGNNGKVQDYTIEIAIYPGNSEVLLIFTGADGSLNGCKDKNIRIAE